MNLFDMLFGAMNDQASVDSLSERSGLTSAQVTKLLPLALPIIMKALTKNASSQAGATSLFNALGRHTSTKPMNLQIQHADQNDGNKILQHIFGGNYDSVVNDLSQQTGANQTQIQSALGSLAPALMSGLSAATTHASNQQASGINLSDGLDLSDLAGLFGAQQQAKPAGGILSALFGGKKPQATVSNAPDGSALLTALLSNMMK